MTPEYELSANSDELIMGMNEQTINCAK